MTNSATAPATAPDTTVEQTTRIISAFVSANPVAASDLPKVITSVHAALAGLGQIEPAIPETRDPAVPVRKSVQQDHIICLEDGKKFKSLKRHLSTRYNLTPAQYREKWGLPADYPMVAPSYSATRSQLAKNTGLGRKPEHRLHG